MAKKDQTEPLSDAAIKAVIEQYEQPAAPAAASEDEQTGAPANLPQADQASEPLNEAAAPTPAAEPDAQPAAAEPASAVPETAELASAEPEPTEPTIAVSETAESATAEPAGPVTAEPENAEPATAEPEPVEPTAAEAHAQGDASSLQAQIDALKAQLAAQQAASLTRALAPNPHNWAVAYRFFKAEPLTLLALTLLAVALPAWWAAWLVIFYLGACYVYPLATKQSRFWWEARLDDWLTDPALRRRQREARAAKQVAAAAARKAAAAQAAAHPAAGQSGAQPSASVAAENAAATAGPAPASAGAVKAGSPAAAQPWFTNNAELWLGLAAAIAGFFMQQSGSAAGSFGTQLGAVLQDGTLASDGYVFIWGYLALRLGGMAVAGGLVKGFMHKANNGAVLKALAVIAGAGAAAVASYVYAHPFAAAYGAARAAYENGASLEDIANLASVVQYLPLIVMGVYGVGIVVNVVGRRHAA
ncbi:hypothetical protein ACFQ3L_02605 [Lacticaseibacillus jixianensis]|uniref:Uncharacterized protein n=1 Tax=Lacticaseibacillus jixianensis TaxID=2486012 RepID=A0ABW4B6F8_9LACO|nr:hypothetical protein [Lacticaseibacillus jixianensis]